MKINKMVTHRPPHRANPLLLAVGGAFVFCRLPVCKIISIWLFALLLCHYFEKMEMIIFITATVLSILALSTGIAVELCRWMLSGITSYGLYKWVFPSVHIWSLEEYKDIESYFMFLRSEHVLWSIIFIGGSYIIFHKLIRLFFINFINLPLENLFTKLFSKMPNEFKRMIKAIIIKYSRNKIRKAKQRGFLKRAKKHTVLTFSDMSENIYSSSVFTIHIISCWFILKLYMGLPIFISVIILMFLILVSVITISAHKSLDNVAGKIIEHESLLIFNERVI